jgi:hypothetical protein
MTDAAKIVLDFKEAPVVVGGRLLGRAGVQSIIAMAERRPGDRTGAMFWFPMIRAADLTCGRTPTPLNQGGV